MATISGYDSSSIGVLFSSINTSASKTSGSMDMLGINYSDYASIRSGSYHKLLSAYYDQGKTIQGVTDKVTKTTTKDDAKTLARIESKAETMKGSADALQETGKKSLFEKVTVTGENGETKTGYDTDAIYKAVNKFVSDYNSLMKEASDSNTKSIKRAADTMANYTKVNEKSLGKLGITIGPDNQLSIDEKTFKAADMEKVKSLFQAKGSYGYQVSKQAALIDTYAKSEAAKANTYSKSGGYTYNYNTGELYNTGI